MKFSKAQLRDTYKAIRKNVQNKEEKARKIALKLFKDPHFVEAQTIALYFNLESEVSTKKIFKEAFSLKKRVVLPRVHQEHLEFYQIDSLSDLEESSFHVKEPVANKDKLVDPKDINLIIVPGICFDKKCHRIGFGGGYYDRFLKEVKAFSIALAFDEQISLEEICVDSWDVQVSKIITDKQDIYRRCSWVNEKNPLYVKYHDEEWGCPVYDDPKLYELLILESFQAGLSWECILNKRENFRKAFDFFQIDKIIYYDEEKIQSLLKNPGIIRNRLKIEATITNSKIFKEIANEYGSFTKYIWHFTNGKVIYETGKTTSSLSYEISADLKRRGMKFVGSTIIYSYLQAIGVINSHEKTCFKF